jgi:putative tryptophan/tyrosine transport system substrate-binding protein
MKQSKITLIVFFFLATIGVDRTHAQQPNETYTIGYFALDVDIFKAQMTQLGYVEGQNINYKVVDPGNGLLDKVMPDDFKAKVQALIDAGVDLYTTNTDIEAVALQKLTGNIPIVFKNSDNPVSTGAAQSLVHPGGNLTGLVTNNPNLRRLQILTEIKPTTKNIDYLYNTSSADVSVRLQQVQALAEKLKVKVYLAPTTDRPTAVDALKQIPEDTDWLYMTPYLPRDAEFYQLLLDAAQSRHLAISGHTYANNQSWVMGYGPNLKVSVQQMAFIVDRIFRGASPADLPIQTADNFLMVNLDTAQTISLPIPESILRQADLIIRPGYYANLKATPSSTPTPASK